MLLSTPIPAFDDNYIWLLQRESDPRAVVVDPGDEAPVITRLEAEDLLLEAILITHRHWDHVGGVAALKARWPDVVVYGPAHEPIKDLDVKLAEGDEVLLHDGRTRFQVLDVPGHTEGHIAYHDESLLLSGDTLFAGGCGRVFGGTLAQLHQSLLKLAALPAHTLVYCAHEYTEHNLGFARWVEPENAALQQRIVATRQLRERGLPSVPSPVLLENLTNPFLRCQQPAVRAAAEHWAGHPLNSDAEVFSALRTWKDKDYD